MSHTIIAALRALLDIVVPPRPTEEVVRHVTVQKLEELAYLRNSQSTGLPYHDPIVTALVWELKYYANKKAARLGGALLREELLAIAQEEIGTILLIPIPMHKDRRRERGHNQTEVLSKAAMTHLSNSFIYEPHALLRVRNTPPQQGLEKHARLKNVYDSMRAAHPEKIKGRVCVVVDDVSTTGATLSEAKRALYAAGARKVYCLALAQS